MSVTASDYSGVITANKDREVGIGITGIYNDFAALQLDGRGISLKNDKDGSSNNWSYIQNSATGSTSNIIFTTGAQAAALTLAHDGTATFTDDVIAFSDRRLKENIKTLDGSKVYDMRGVSFTKKDSGKEGSGVIAQEIQKVAPELINETVGTLGVAYGNLTGYLIEAVKDLKKEVEDLKKQLKNK